MEIENSYDDGMEGVQVILEDNDGDPVTMCKTEYDNYTEYLFEQNYNISITNCIIDNIFGTPLPFEKYTNVGIIYEPGEDIIRALTEHIETFTRQLPTDTKMKKRVNLSTLDFYIGESDIDQVSDYICEPVNLDVDLLGFRCYARTVYMPIFCFLSIEGSDNASCMSMSYTDQEDLTVSRLYQELPFKGELTANYELK